MAVPQDARTADPLTYGALALFAARVQAIDSRFRLDGSNLGSVIEICRLRREHASLAQHTTDGVALLAAALTQLDQLHEALQRAREAARLMSDLDATRAALGE